MLTTDYLRIIIDCPKCGVQDRAERIGVPGGWMHNRKAENFNQSDEMVPHNSFFCGQSLVRRIGRVDRCPQGCIFIWDEGPV